MRRLLAAVLLIAASTPAAAQSLFQPTSWSGAYVGANFGWFFGNDRPSQNVVSGAGFPIIGAGRPLYGGASSFANPTEGPAGGGQIGYNWLMPNNVLLGVETDLQASGLKGHSACTLPCGQALVTTTPPGLLNFFPVIFSDHSFESRINWFGTARARVGYTRGPALVYLTGGLAYGEVTRSGSVVGRTTLLGLGTVNRFQGAYNNSSTRVGWTLGGGAEAKLSNAWSVKFEYLYIDLGRSVDTFPTIFTQGGGGAVVGRTAAVRTDTSYARDHVARVGVNYAIGAR